MSLQATVAAWSTKDITPTEKLVLLALANRHNHDTGMCFPSIPRMMDDTGLGERTIFRALKSLEAKGVLKCLRTPGKSTRYLLPTEQVAEESSPTDPCHRGSDPCQSDRGTPATEAVTPATEAVTPATVAPELISNLKGNLKKRAVNKFTPPARQEVEDYMLSKGVTFEQASTWAVGFWNYYESNGWKVGKNKMQKWKAAATGWLNRELEKGNGHRQGQTAGKHQSRIGDILNADF